MRVSSRLDYGVRALYELARHRDRGPLQSRDIAQRQGIPEAYLHQLLGALGRAGLVRSTRGPQGGHQLARQPERITLLDVMRALEGTDHQRALAAPDGPPDVVSCVWNDLQNLTEQYLADITLATLVERSRSFQPDYVI